MPDYNCLPITTTVNSNIGLTGAATAHEAVNDPVGANDGDTTKIARSGTTVNGEVRFTKQTLPSLASIASVTLTWIAKQVHSGGSSVDALIKPYLYIAGVKYYAPDDTPSAAGYTVRTKVWLLSPATGLLFTKGEFETAEFGFELPRDEGEFNSIQHITSTYLTVNGVPAEPGKSRQIGTAYLDVVRRGIEFMRTDVDVRILDNTLGDDLSLWHIEHPLAQVLGKIDRTGKRKTGIEDWRSVLAVFHDVKIDGNALACEVTLQRRRDNLISLLDSAYSRVSAASIENGVEFLSLGTRFYTRNSLAYNTDPLTGLVVPYQVNERPFSRDGFMPESAARNWVWNSAAVTDLSNVTDPGGGSGTLTRETPAFGAVFRSDASNACFVFTAGSPHTNANVREWTTDEIPNGTLLRFSLDHLDNVSGLEWQLQGDVTGTYWNDSTGAWGGNVWNAVTVRSGTAFRDRSAFKIGNDADQIIYVRLRQPSGGTAGRVNRVYQVQLESNVHGMMTSRIVTPASGIADRAISVNGATNDVTRRSFNNAYGTAFFELLPNWAQADLTDGIDPVVFYILFSTGMGGIMHGWSLKNDSTADELRFRMDSGTTVFTASVPWAPSGTVTRVAVRWLPINAAMHGLAAGTMSIFLNGVKGIDAVRSVDPTEASTSNLYYGTDGGSLAFDGVVRRVRFVPQVYSDAEIASFKW